MVESPTAASWLRSTGLDCLELTSDQLEAGAPDVPLMIVPLDRVRSEATVRAVTAFAGRGGKIIAVYWGTIARPEQQAAYPVYRAIPLLGVRVAGWTLVGPAVVRPALAAPGADAPAGEPRPTFGTPAVPRPPAPATADRLRQVMIVRVEPEPAAQVLAQLIPISGGPPVALAVRNGNVFYVAANLFQVDSGSAEMRRLFFWVLDKAAPGLVFAGVRERAGAAVAAVIRARERLTGQTAPTAASVRKLLDDAEAAASRARSLAAADDFTGSLAASDQARELAQRALAVLDGH